MPSSPRWPKQASRPNERTKVLSHHSLQEKAIHPPGPCLGDVCYLKGTPLCHEPQPPVVPHARRALACHKRHPLHNDSRLSSRILLSMNRDRRHKSENCAKPSHNTSAWTSCANLLLAARTSAPSSAAASRCQKRFRRLSRF